MNEFDRDKYPENEIKNLNEINKNHNRQNLKIFSEVYKNNTPERLSHLRSRSIKKDDIEIREDDEVA